jgi:hypothetical protein
MELQNSLIRKRIRSAIDYLLTIQNKDGSWRDYCLPVGESDQWVTAFTALGVMEASRKIDYRDGVNAAQRGAEFLLKCQVYEAGWGYNRHVGVDADSTAHALLLFRGLDIPVAQKDELCLIAHRNDNGVFCTYISDSGWGMPHPEVTAAAALALSQDSLEEIRDRLIDYSNACRLSTGEWPTYWWRNHQYGTYYMLAMRKRLGCPVPSGIAKMEIKIESCFDLAWTIGILAQIGSHPQAVTKALRALFCMQKHEGAWPSSRALRVTDPKCAEPWISQLGEFYVDINSTITTSSALRVLSLLIPA